MSESRYYSIRMHASEGEKHVSGAERIVYRDEVETAAGQLIARALSKGRAAAKITITVENLGAEQPHLLTALDVVTVGAVDPETAHSSISEILGSSGVSDQAVRKAIHVLSNGAAPNGENMRGAIIMDSITGDRLEPDQARGVRATRFDWKSESAPIIRQTLLQCGLPHVRTFEALALATKIAFGPGVVAELCWSDDPDYTAGYVASRKNGYIRFPFLKNAGQAKGGRVIFVEPSADVRKLIDYLEGSPVLIDKIGRCVREPDIAGIINAGRR